MKLTKITLIISALFSVGAFAEDIPVVPTSVATKNLPALAPVAPKLDQGAVAQAVQSGKEKATPIVEDNIVQITPGTNIIIPIAINHPNRIVTPFDHPVVLNDETSKPEIRDNVLYFSPTSDALVSWYITDGDNQDTAISITLMPKRIPPREITLVGDVNFNSKTVNRKAEKWEKSQPYVATLQSILKDVALGQVPSGYAVMATPPSTVIVPSCRPNGLRVEFGKQTLVGHNLVVHVGLATNLSKNTVEFDEDSCADWDIAAVAAFPKLVLKPGEKTEVYVIQKFLKPDTSKKPRASLLTMESNK